MDPKPCPRCGHRDPHQTVLIHYEGAEPRIEERLRCTYRDLLDRPCECDAPPVVEVEFGWPQIFLTIGALAAAAILVTAIERLLTRA